MHKIFIDRNKLLINFIRVMLGRMQKTMKHDLWVAIDTQIISTCRPNMPKEHMEHLKYPKPTTFHHQHLAL
jgi:hypothetical protein